MSTDNSGSDSVEMDVQATAVYACSDGHEPISVDLPVEEVLEDLSYYHAEPCEHCGGMSALTVERVMLESGEELPIQEAEEGSGVSLRV